MKLTEKDIELIDAYIRGKLKDEEKAEFESRLHDEHFTSELEYRSDLKVATKSVVSENRKKILKEEETILTSLENQGSQPMLGNRWNWLLIIVILFTIIYFIIKSLGDKPVDSQTLFAEFYKPYPNVVNPIQMGTKTEIVSPYHLYEEGKYRDAIASFEAQSDLTESTQFYKGLSYFYNGDIDLAKSIMTEITQNQSHRYYQSSEWYLSGILLKENQREKALRLLKKMSSDDQHPYSTKANNLMNKVF